MKKRIITILTLIIAGSLVDLGLVTVFMDSAYRGNSSSISYTALILVFIFPFLLILGFYKKLTKIIASVALLIATLCMTYHIFVYGLKMINGDIMTFVSFGFVVTVILLGRLLYLKSIDFA